MSIQLHPLGRLDSRQIEDCGVPVHRRYGLVAHHIPREALGITHNRRDADPSLEKTSLGANPLAGDLKIETSKRLEPIRNSLIASRFCEIGFVSFFYLLVNCHPAARGLPLQNSGSVKCLRRAVHDGKSGTAIAPPIRLSLARISRQVGRVAAGPFPRSCPASPLLWPCPTSRRVRPPCRGRGSSELHPPGPPFLHCGLPSPTCPAHYPGGPSRCACRLLAVSCGLLRRVGVRDFPFRGLLRLTARYGLPACSPSFPWTLSPGFRETDYPATLLVSFPACRQLHRWAPSSHRVSAPKRRTEKSGLKE